MLVHQAHDMCQEDNWSSDLNKTDSYVIKFLPLCKKLVTHSHIAIETAYKP